VAILAALFLVAQGWRPVSGQVEPHGGAEAYARDLAMRRASVMDRLASESVLILWSAPHRVYSDDTNYEYRQESNLLYLSGMTQPETTLVLVGGPDGVEEHLFVEAADPVRELWEGRVLTAAEASALSGIASVHPQTGTEAFDRFIDDLFQGDPSADADVGPKRVFMLGPVPGERSGLPDGLPEAVVRLDWARDLASRHPDLSFRNVTPVLARQRAIKSGYEQDLLRRSVAVSAEAHVEGMRVTWPGRWEYEVEAAIEYTFHRLGALSWGYPSIVAGGPNATILHYIKSTRRLEDGDLLLVDAAGNYQGITGDITRTYPVNGRFSPEQRALYELVLEAWEAGVAAATPGGQVSAISQAVRASLGTGLLELGLVTDPAAATGDSPQVRYWFPHEPTHGIGVDVHDPLFALDPGAAFVIEPGLYIRPDVLERLEADPSTRALAAELRPTVERYLDIGIRIEDSFLMTASGPESLSDAVPREADEVEQLVGTARPVR